MAHGGSGLGRPKNRLPTWELTVSTNPLIQSYLQDLVDTGMYGNGEPEAAERLIVSTVEQLIEAGKLKRRPPWQPPTT